MSRLDHLAKARPIPTWRPIAWMVMIFLGGGVVWSNFAQLDEVAVAMGEVVPQGKVKVIQHLEGGIVQAIHVTEGAHVKEGDPLVQLDLATSGVNREELQVRLDGHFLARARLIAEVNQKELDFPLAVAERRPTLVAQERRAYTARQVELGSSMRVLGQQKKQRALEVEELEAKQRATAHNLRLARERFQMSTNLLAKKLTARMEHLELEAEVESLEGELMSLKPAIPRARAAVQEAEDRMQEVRNSFLREAEESLGAEEQNIARIREVLIQATDQNTRAEIKSPINGIVKNMRYHTIGGVVKPGEAIMEIVPSGNKLLVDARMQPTDVGYVQVGQKAVVKISTYDFVRYGGLDGSVVQVAPDSSTDQNTGETYFQVVVKTDKTWLGEMEGQLPITPGMEATVDIHTGEKSVLDYLVKPVLKLRHEAFRER
ncbi:HlyD family type I secretion periplasmic adaptor subunit [Magnetospira sp. QH-2]|uniref:HlyD family type I secretion periplasmic adaptor subunit n=1 Tax=Magnetospira sp. (strain QH-2) TaxID=1288970 RepID=UPI0003E8187F|nr:HlyD family type I secretion periplasmic adaptor subunit [Magnetospira sp. QH-2]CCQ73427.1 Putative membrane-fusion protein; Multidrug resistance efflux pump [Magnetospira sp. QH-2]